MDIEEEKKREFYSEFSDIGENDQYLNIINMIYNLDKAIRLQSDDGVIEKMYVNIQESITKFKNDESKLDFEYYIEGINKKLNSVWNSYLGNKLIEKNGSLNGALREIFEETEEDELEESAGAPGFGGR